MGILARYNFGDISINAFQAAKLLSAQKAPGQGGGFFGGLRYLGEATKLIKSSEDNALKKTLREGKFFRCSNGGEMKFSKTLFSNSTQGSMEKSGNLPSAKEPLPTTSTPIGEEMRKVVSGTKEETQQLLKASYIRTNDECWETICKFDKDEAGLKAKRKEVDVLKTIVSYIPESETAVKTITVNADYFLGRATGIRQHYRPRASHLQGELSRKIQRLDSKSGKELDEALADCQKTADEMTRLNETLVYLDDIDKDATHELSGLKQSVIGFFNKALEGCEAQTHVYKELIDQREQQLNHQIKQYRGLCNEFIPGSEEQKKFYRCVKRKFGESSEVN